MCHTDEIKDTIDCSVLCVHTDEVRVNSSVLTICQNWWCEIHCSVSSICPH